MNKFKVYYDKADNWYDQFIEKPLGEIINYLRNNGVNTECSCGHDGHIQCQYLLDGEFAHIHRIMFLYLHKKKMPINYTIKVDHKVDEGHSYTSLYIDIPGLKQKPEKPKRKCNVKVRKINKSKV